MGLESAARDGNRLVLRCGRIRYTNVLPLYAAFDEGALIYPGKLHEDVPTRLNAMMRASELDVGAVSAFEYATHRERYVLLPDPCVGAREEVISVALVSPLPPALLDGTSIAVTPDSASGRALLRLILERRYGVRARYRETADAAARARAGEAALLIGDEAIDAVLSAEPSHVYDLGLLWRQWTGEESVFAVWVARREIFESQRQAVESCVRAHREARAWANSHMDRVVKLAQQRKIRPAGFYERYYGKLNFTFTPDAQRGLDAYCRHVATLETADAAR